MELTTDFTRKCFIVTTDTTVEEFRTLADVTAKYPELQPRMPAPRAGTKLAERAERKQAGVK